MRLNIKTRVELEQAVEANDVATVKRLVEVDRLLFTQAPFHKMDDRLEFKAVKAGALAVLRYLWSQASFDLFPTDHQGQGMLYLSVMGGHEDTALWLIDRAREQGGLLKLISPIHLKKGGNYYSQTLLMQACAKNMVRVVDECLPFCDATLMNKAGESALSQSLASLSRPQGDERIIKKLLPLVDVNAVDQEGIHVLSRFAMLPYRTPKDLEPIEHLLNWNLVDKAGNGAIDHALRRADLTWIQYIAPHVNLTVVDRYGDNLIGRFIKDTPPLINTKTEADRIPILNYLAEFMDDDASCEGQRPTLIELASQMNLQLFVGALHRLAAQREHRELEHNTPLGVSSQPRKL